MTSAAPSDPADDQIQALLPPSLQVERHGDGGRAAADPRGQAQRARTTRPCSGSRRSSPPRRPG